MDEEVTDHQIAALFEEVALLRLSSKSHWDVPVRIDDTVVRILASHPTPPVFDGPEDANGRRNHDEIRFWADYLTGGPAAGYIRDDRGRAGGLPAKTHFIIAGDLNADPVKDPKTYGYAPIDLLLKHPRVLDPAPESKGAAAHDAPYPGNKATRTCHFGRIDYALPSKTLRVQGTGVFWPAPTDPLSALVKDREASSDHRLVWLDMIVP